LVWFGFSALLILTDFSPVYNMLFALSHDFIGHFCSLIFGGFCYCELIPQNDCIDVFFSAQINLLSLISVTAT